MGSFAKPIRAAILAAALTVAAASSGADKPPPFDPNFPKALSPVLPGDVDTVLQKELDAAKEFDATQRLFDLLSWQSFLALNWPTDKAGIPAKSIADRAFGPPAWNRLTESQAIFRADGKEPRACAPKLAQAAAAQPRELAIVPVRGQAALPEEAGNSELLVLGNVTAVGELSPLALDRLDDTTQAFSGPLVDQNHNFVFYQIFLDPNEVGYICQNKLYNLNGQAAFSQAGNTVKFPQGDFHTPSSGAIELKLAWKILEPGKGDLPERFLTMQAFVPDATTATHWRKVTVGLVGMHIAHKTASSPQWIWSTFEQVDNLQGGGLAHPKIKASFFNPATPTALVNTQPDTKIQPLPPTQVLRAIPIPPDKEALNHQVQQILAAQHSVLQYYQLIDTQWPTDPGAYPTPPGDANLPDAIANKSGGRPTPVYLTNMTMETYFQQGNQPAYQQEENAPQTVAMAFGTESCMGCHSSAGVATSVSIVSGKPKATFGGQLTGDFSWLLKQKATFGP